MKFALLIAAGALIGGGIGFSQILCPDGQCMITGSWFGGGTIGGLLGYAAAGLLPARIDPRTLRDHAADADADGDRDAAESRHAD
jgi:hypothetical protein